MPATDGRAAGDAVKGKLAYVLIMDIVGYSQHGLEQQKLLIEKLTEIVWGVLVKHSLLTVEGDPALLPTGDGMVLVFIEDGRAPILCAWALTAEIREYNRNCGREQERIRLRMGIDAAQVLEVELKTATGMAMNYAGPAINEAQRIMDCGGDRHILCSSSYHGIWRRSDMEGLFHDVGSYPVKGDVRQVFNLYGKLVVPAVDGDVAYLSAGNREAPRRRVFVNVSSIPRHYPEHTALASFLWEECEKGLTALKSALRPVSGDDVWKVVIPLLARHRDLVQSNPKARLELISLINPSTWGTDSGWLDYNRMVVRIARGNQRRTAETDVKRLHVLSSSAKTDAKLMEDLLVLMICESIGHIQCRALFVHDEGLRVDRTTGTFQTAGLSLFDYGTYRTGGQKDIIFSNMAPYFKGGGSDWGITTFGIVEDAIFHALQANFYRGWVLSPQERIYGLKRLYDEQARQIHDFHDKIASRIVTCLPNVAGLPIDQAEAHEAMRSIPPPRSERDMCDSLTQICAKFD
ncbi:MAG: hypothetical protein NTX53_18670 [candidate division WOR-3 bacterium]|nr:hypothetical protein [candidate division WOR-3 bacterium]